MALSREIQSLPLVETPVASSPARFRELVVLQPPVTEQDATVVFAPLLRQAEFKEPHLDAAEKKYQREYAQIQKDIDAGRAVEVDEADLKKKRRSYPDFVQNYSDRYKTDIMEVYGPFLQAAEAATALQEPGIIGIIPDALQEELQRCFREEDRLARRSQRRVQKIFSAAADE